MATIEAQVPTRCTLRVKRIQSLGEQFKQLPEYRDRVESYPLWSLRALVLLAVLYEGPRGPEGPGEVCAGFQSGSVAPSEFPEILKVNIQLPISRTFCPFFFQRIEDRQVEEAILAIQERVRGKAPKRRPGRSGWQKNPKAWRWSSRRQCRHPFPASFTWAVPSWGKDKTNEIPVARRLFERLDLAGRLVSLDALPAQDGTARPSAGTRCRLSADREG